MPHDFQPQQWDTDVSDKGAGRSVLDDDAADAGAAEHGAASAAKKEDIPPPPTRRCPEGPAADAAAGLQLAIPAPGGAPRHGASEHEVLLGKRCRHTIYHSHTATPQQLEDAKYRQMILWDWQNVMASKNFYNAHTIYQH